MKKNKFIVGLILIITILAGFTGCNSNAPKVEIHENVQEQYIDKNTIEYTGWLKTEGSELKNEHGEPIQLRGLSSHGIQWFPEVLTYENLEQLKNNWKINVFRIAMYTDQNANGYIAHPEKSKEEVDKIVDYAKRLDMYVVVDWHILSDKNPQIYQSQAKEFFAQMAEKYADVPNVIYEICNEPNGSEVRWDENVKPYAEDIISTIRAKSPKSLIIVGTPDWCKDLKSAANNPLAFDNIVYSCHFYAGTHGEELQKQINYCIEKNIPVFVSECGITDASGAGNIYTEKFQKWIDFLSEKNISWIYWSFCNKAEGSSILSPEYPITKIETTVNDSNSNSQNNNLQDNNSQNIQNNNTQNNNIQNTTNNNTQNITNNTDSTNNDSSSDSSNKETVKIDDYLTDAGKLLKQILCNNK